MSKMAEHLIELPQATDIRSKIEPLVHHSFFEFDWKLRMPYACMPAVDSPLLTGKAS